MSEICKNCDFIYQLHGYDETAKCLLSRFNEPIQNGYEVNCEYYKDCYYKQLQQLKQENEELREKLKQADEDIKSECTRCVMTNFLGEKLERIKEYINKYSGLIFDETTCTELLQIIEEV